MANHIVAAFCTILVLAGSGPAFADVPRHCVQVEQSYEDSLRLAKEDRGDKNSFEAALAQLDILTKQWLETRIGDPGGARNEILAGDPPVWTEDQPLILQRVEVLYCDIIFSQATPGNAAKRKRLDSLTEKVYEQEPPDRLVDNTLGQHQTRRPGPAAPVDGLAYTFMHASFTSPGAQHATYNGSARRQESALPLAATWSENELNERIVFLAAGPPQNKNSVSHGDSDESASAADDRFDGPETEFLARAPYVVNETNKYFVILASPKTEEKGRSMMDEFKKSSPQHDFALYSPYRLNAPYAIMMATWVSEDVAIKARAAGREVAKSHYKEKFKELYAPYLWCYPAGAESCHPDGRQNSDPDGKMGTTKKSEAI